MKNIIIGIRWKLAFAALRLAKAVCIKNCDYGERLHRAADGFFFYTNSGRETQ